jgi:lipoprotein-releasing system permease protein
MGPRGFVALLAGRLIRRRGSAPSWARTLGWVALVGVVAAGIGLALGLRGPLVIAGSWLACLAGLVAVLVARLRAMLVVAVLGLALGVASMFVVLGVGSGIESLLISSLARLNGHAMINKYGLDFAEYEQVAAALEGDPRVHAASPFVFGVGAIVVVDAELEARGGAGEGGAGEGGAGEGDAGEGDAEEGGAGEGGAGEGGAIGGEPVVVTLKGVDPRRLARFTAVDELFATGGLASLRPADPRQLPGVALGIRLAKRIGAEPGARVRVVVPAEIRQDSAAQGDGDGGRPRYAEFEVLGLIETGFAEFDSSFALVHLSAAQAIVFGEGRVSGIEIELRDAEVGTTMAIAESLAAALNQPRVAEGKPPLYRAGSWVERSAVLTSIRQTKAGLALIISLIVVVASGSLLGALLLLVRRERPHIGVLAALGARPSQLFWAFEAVGVTIGALGSGFGLALGSISLAALTLLRLDLDPDIYMIDHLPVAFVLTDMLIPTALAILVCAVVTGPIARRVAQIRPLALLG